jgi:hypothetical protein
VAIDHPSLSDIAAQDALFKAAIRQGLSAENVNSAASFFVRGLAGWERQIVQLRGGRMGTVFRPTLTLFVALKLARATEVDLSDVRSATGHFGASDFDEAAFRQLATPVVLERFEKYRASFPL